MKDLTAYPISTSTPLEDEQPMDEDTISGQGSLSIALAVVPFPTPNMDMASILNPTPRLTRRSCNKPYTLEQIHFIQYCREDHKLSWPETEVRFKERFTDPARDVSMVGLQCRYYRAQKYPMLDVDGNPVLDDNGMIIMHNLTVRKRGQKEGLKVPILDDNRRPVYNGESQIIMRDLVEDELHGHLGRNLRAVYQTYFKLVDRVPEHAAEYRWVRNEHKTAAKIIAKHNQDHGIELPGAVLPGGVEVETIMWEEEIARRNSVGEASKKSNSSSMRRSMPIREKRRSSKSPRL